jgi:hypothetical protein
LAVQLFWTDEESGETESVQFDVVESESHDHVLTITDHPVEEGANVSDHAREEPTRLTLEGFVSNVTNRAIDEDAADEAEDVAYATTAPPSTKTVALEVPSPPIHASPSGLLQAGIGALKGAILGGPKGTFRDRMRRVRARVTAQFYRQRSPRNRVRDVFDKLLRAQSQRALIYVSTPHREYDDMLLERVPLVRGADTGLGASIAVDLRRIRVASSETVKAPEPAEKRGQLTKAGGSKGAKPDPNSEAKSEVYESTLSSLTP